MMQATTMTLRTQLLLVFLLTLAFSTLTGCAAALVVGLGAGVVVAHDRRSAGAFVDDAVIEFKAEAELASDPKLKGPVHINITSMNGIVLLTGEAATAELHDRVLALVRKVPNIRRITNEIRIAPPSALGTRSQDGWISTQVKGRFVGTKGLDPTRVKVVTENAVVYLMGLVASPEGELAANAASAVRGVTQVVKLFEYID